MELREGRVLLTDLRIGQEPHYSFVFDLGTPAQLDAGQTQPHKVSAVLSSGFSLSALIDRILGRDLRAPPRRRTHKRRPHSDPFFLKSELPAQAGSAPATHFHSRLANTHPLGTARVVAPGRTGRTVCRSTPRLDRPAVVGGVVLATLTTCSPRPTPPAQHPVAGIPAPARACQDAHAFGFTSDSRQWFERSDAVAQGSYRQDQPAASVVLSWVSTHRAAHHEFRPAQARPRLLWTQQKQSGGCRAAAGPLPHAPSRRVTPKRHRPHPHAARWPWCSLPTAHPPPRGIFPLRPKPLRIRTTAPAPSHVRHTPADRSPCQHLALLSPSTAWTISSCRPAAPLAAARAAACRSGDSVVAASRRRAAACLWGCSSWRCSPCRARACWA